MKEIIKHDEVKKIKESIKKVLPYAHTIEVKVLKIPKVGFKSFIQVKAPQRRKVVALKTDKDIKKSLEKSHRAILKQIRKFKTKRFKNVQEREHLLHLCA